MKYDLGQSNLRRNHTNLYMYFRNLSQIFKRMNPQFVLFTFSLTAEAQKPVDEFHGLSPSADSSGGGARLEGSSDPNTFFPS